MTTKLHHFSHSLLPHHRTIHGVRVPDLSRIVHSQVVEILVSIETNPFSPSRGVPVRVRSAPSCWCFSVFAMSQPKGAQRHRGQTRRTTCGAAEEYAETCLRSAAPRPSPIGVGGSSGSESSGLHVCGASCRKCLPAPSREHLSNSREVRFPQGRIPPSGSSDRWRAGSTRAKPRLTWHRWVACPIAPQKIGCQARRRRLLMSPLISSLRSCVAIGGAEAFNHGDEHEDHLTRPQNRSNGRGPWWHASLKDNARLARASGVEPGRLTSPAPITSVCRRASQAGKRLRDVVTTSRGRAAASPS